MKPRRPGAARVHRLEDRGQDRYEHNMRIRSRLSGQIRSSVTKDADCVLRAGSGSVAKNSIDTVCRPPAESRSR